MWRMRGVAATAVCLKLSKRDNGVFGKQCMHGFFPIPARSFIRKSDSRGIKNRRCVPSSIGGGERMRYHTVRTCDSARDFGKGSRWKLSASYEVALERNT